MKALRRILLGLAALLLLLVLVTVWLLFSASGAATVLSFANRAVPGLEVIDIEGALGTGLNIREIRYRQAAREVLLENVTLTGRLTMWNDDRGALDIGIARATLTDRAAAPTKTRLEWPSLPLLPLTVDPLTLNVAAFKWLDANGKLKLSAKLQANGRIEPSGITLREIQITGPTLNANGQLKLSTGPIQPVGKLTFKDVVDGQPFDLDFSAERAANYAVTLDVRAPVLSTLQLSVAPNNALSGEWLLPKQTFGDTPISGKLALAGSVDQPILSGRLRWAENRLRNLNLALKIEPEAIVITSLEAALAKQIDALSATGRIDLNPAPSVTLTGSLTPEASLTRALDGLQALLRLTFDLKATADAANVNVASAAAKLNAKLDWTPVEIRFSAAQAERMLAQGTLQAGVLAAQIELSRFDPGTMLRDWPGEISGALNINAPNIRQREGIQIALMGLNGVLRERPISADGTLLFGAAPEPGGEVNLALGQNTIRYNGPESGRDPQVTLALPELAALMPELRGQLTGVISARNEVLDIALEASDLGYGEFAAAQSTLNGKLALQPQANSALTLTATGLLLAGEAVAATELKFSGNLENQQLDLQLQHGAAALGLRATGGVANGAARYQIDALSVTPKGQTEWRNAGAATLQLSDKRREIQDLCLTQQSAKLCLDASVDAELNGNAKALLTDVDLATLSSALGLSKDISLRGVINGNASVTLQLGQISALDAALALPLLAANLRREDREIELKGLLVSAQGNAEQINVRLRSQADAPTFVDGDLQMSAPLGVAEQQLLSGRVKFGSTAVLPWLLSSDDVRGVRGAINADMVIGGSRAQPTLSGELKLDKFGLRMPAYGTQLSRVELIANVAALDQITIDGTGQLGKGALQFAGNVSLQPFKLRLDISGRDLSLVNTSSIKLTGSPDLNLVLEDGLWQINGQVEIPTGQILLDQFNDALRASEDQEFTDVDPTVETAALPLMTDIDLTLGPAVDLSGAGLTGKLSGAVKLRVKPGEPPSGDGALSVDGRYLAFGRKLDIETARLRFADSPLSNPFLDINATRLAGNVKAGVRVRGTAAAPDIRVYTDPASTQSDALSYLVLGRPLSQSRAGDQAQLSGAAKNLGGGLLAQELGARFGLDAVSLEDAAGFDGPRLMLGKYLSPRLYVAYGISQFDSSTLFRVRYLINSRFDVEAERGEELRATVNYRRDK